MDILCEISFQWFFMECDTYHVFFWWLAGLSDWDNDELQWMKKIGFYPAALKAPGYCRTPSGRAGGRQGRQAPLTLSRP